MTWLYVPSTSSESAPEPGPLSLASESPSAERMASLTWRGKPAPPPLWSQVWRRGGFIRRLSGLISEPSTLDHGVASWISSLRATRASPTASPEIEREPRTIDSLSTSSSALPTSAGLIVSCARTSRGTRTGNSRPSSRHWKDWATALLRESSQRQNVASSMMASGSGPSIAAPDSSSWPTARVARGGYTRDKGDPAMERPSLEGAASQWQTPGTDSFRSRGGDRKDEMGLDQQARTWATPKASSGGANSKRQARGAGGPDLMEQVSDWATPQARDHMPAHRPERIAKLKAEGHGMRNLNDEAAMWPTPNAGIFNDGENPDDWQARHDRHRARGIRNAVPLTIAAQRESWSTPRSSDAEKGGPNQEFSGGGIPLPAQAANWPTPATRDFKGANDESHMDRSTGKLHLDQLPNAVEHSFRPLRLDPATPLGARSLTPIPFSPLPSEQSTSGPLLAEISALRRWSERSGGAAGWRGTWTRRPRRVLNPRFVEWLMCWPSELSGFGRAATGLSPWLSRMRGLLLGICSRPTEPPDQPRLL